MPTRELDELDGFRTDRGVLSGTADVHAAAPAKLHEALISQEAQCPQNGVGVDAEHGCDVTRRRQPFTRPCLVLRDRVADGVGDLVVEQRRMRTIDLDIKHDAIHSSVMSVSDVHAGPRLPARSWAVIKDARRRQRRRHRRVGTLLTAALLIVAGFVRALRGTAPAGNGRLLSRAASPPVHRAPIAGSVLDAASAPHAVWVLSCVETCSGMTASRGELVELAAGSGRVLHRFPVADPQALTFADGSIWIAHFLSGLLTRVDPSSGRVTASVQLTLPRPVIRTDRRFLPDAISAGTRRLWISTARGWVAEVNPRTARVVAMLPSPSEATSTVATARGVWSAQELDGIGLSEGRIGGRD